MPLSPRQTSQCMWLMQALGFLLSALPVEEILRNLHSLITPYIQQLEKLADETVCMHDSHAHATRAHMQCNAYNNIHAYMSNAYTHKHILPHMWSAGTFGSWPWEQIL